MIKRDSKKKPSAVKQIKSIARDQIKTKAASSSKKKWEELLKDPKAKQMMKKVWSSKNPQEEYKKIINRISKGKK